MKALRVIAAVMDYPREELWSHCGELLEAARHAELPDARRAQLVAFLTSLLDRDVIDAQERWLEVFDRGRAMSLLLFEHIHGESRDRGQAMVDLIDTYRRNGEELATRELPDYLPVVLEHLSRRSDGEVRDWLGHIGHILELLAARAHQRGSAYAVLFEMLAELGQGHVDLDLMRRRVEREVPDDTPEAMDRVWEEEMVRFADETTATCAPSPSHGVPEPSTVARPA
ncbi:nitrate reductase molybdenum cofactor assembly chaperone [Lysobacter sp.]|uniref:nitrate reductase molybdenum cofactor assembly chaperone n=1 Tax=Lysobacter sp. TaxID=72226 RepID=UPI002D39060A|nr:nitrate reductase molybdenum cofactor assembly chaperone [Lysobacter sp.]HZX75771.1 nitrate reductase molybdenum cofactor assembly chaperone [Lysobacter sp.]